MIKVPAMDLEHESKKVVTLVVEGITFISLKISYEGNAVSYPFRVFLHPHC
jgi:hypothetical protein